MRCVWFSCTTKLAFQLYPLKATNRRFTPLKKYFISRCTKDCFLAEIAP